MDIIKEVSIKANIDYIWSRILKNNVSDKKHRLEFKGSPDLKRKWEIGEIRPRNFILLKGRNKLSDISIRLEFSPKNDKTSMKLKIQNWEKIDSEVSRREIPKISLEWENILKNYKKRIEASIKNRATTNVDK